MSHFTTIVLGDDVQGQLEPYDENIQVEPYPNWQDDTDKALDYMRQNEPVKLGPSLTTRPRPPGSPGPSERSASTAPTTLGSASMTPRRASAT